MDNEQSLLNILFSVSLVSSCIESTIASIGLCSFPLLIFLLSLIRS